MFQSVNGSLSRDDLVIHYSQAGYNCWEIQLSLQYLHGHQSSQPLSIEMSENTIQNE